MTRSECDSRAEELVGGNVVAVTVQGACSYTVYAGKTNEFVVQFRLKFLELRTETINLAQRIYGSFVPRTSYEGCMGKHINIDGKEPLYVYFMSRVRESPI